MNRTTARPDATDRSAAARRLRAARHSRCHVDALLACAALPDSRAARRLAIESALRHDDQALAEALIAQSLHKTPGDPSILRLRARCRLRNGELEAATRDLIDALSREPLRWGTHLMLARAERRRGRLSLAEAYLDHARALAGDLPVIRHEAARCALKRGSPEQAVTLLTEDSHACLAFNAPQPNRAGNPPRVLLMRALASAGRMPDACDLAEGILRTSRRRAAQQAAVHVLSRCGDLSRLRRIIRRASRRTPRDRVELLPLRLATGDFRGIITCGFPHRHGSGSGTALTLMAIAATRLGRAGLADLCVARLRRSASPPPRSETIATMWAKGLFADRRLHAARSASVMVDPPTGLLHALLAA